MTNTSANYDGLRSSVSRRLEQLRAQSSAPVAASKTNDKKSTVSAKKEPAASSTPDWLVADRAVAKERARIGSVLQSPESKGRERAAMEMLAYGKADAATIVGLLAALPNGAELARQRAADTEKRTQSVWDAALARL